MATPTVSVNDGKHKLIVAEQGERVLTPSQNKTWEMGHPNARRQPMHANVVYDDGGNVAPAPDISGLPMGHGTNTPATMPTQNPTAPKPKKDSGPMLPGQPLVDVKDSPMMDQEAFDEGGTVKAEPSTGEKIAARAEEIYKGVKAAPENEEAKAFKEKQDMVNSVMTPPVPVETGVTNNSVAADRMHPSASYGMGKGERRIYTDPQGNVIDPTTPQGMGAAGPSKPTVSMNSSTMGKMGSVIPDEEQPKGYTPIKDNHGEMLGLTTAYDEGGTVGSAMGKAKDLMGKGKALAATEDNEAKSFREKEQMVDSLKEVPKQEEAVPVPQKHEVDPTARYGTKTGEKRLDHEGNAIDSTTPQGMGAAGPKRPVPAALYDEGGDVTADPEKQAAIAQATKEVTGEGAPADFAGPVIPNPKGSKVMSDTDSPAPETEKLTGGAHMSTDNYKGGTEMNTENPPMNDMGTPMEREASAKGKPTPMSGSAQMGKQQPIEQPMSNGTTDVPMGEQAKNEASAEAAGLEVKHGPAVDPEKAKQAEVLKADKLAAMGKGSAGLADLGTAMIHEKALGLGKTELPTPTPVAPTKEQSQANERQQVLQQEEQLRNTMLNGATEQERFQAEKDLSELKRRTPWGSEGSAHPGTMGKIGHAVSAIAQGIGQGIAPYAVNAIPGSRADIARQENLGEQGVEQAQKKAQQAATTAVEQGKPELQQEQQRITEEKNKMTNEAALRKQGNMRDASGNIVPIPYEELSAHEQGVYDLNQAKAHAQDAIAELKSAQADPTSPQSQLILAKAKAEGEKMDQAGQKLGLDVDKYKAEYLGVDHNNNPLAGVQTTPEGKPIGTKVTGAKGAKPTANQTMKADLAENVVHNVDKATKLIRSNPDLFGKVSGKFTTAAQMIGSNDPAIAKLGLIIHNTALATNGIHGLRSAQAIEGTEKELLNKFKNSPEATIAALKENRRSVGDFMRDGGKPLIPDPDLVPKGASAEVLDKDGNVTGHIVNNKYVALPKE